MQYLDPKEFGRQTAEGRPCGHYDISFFYGLGFECACSQVHELKPWMEIVCELPLFKFVISCPEGHHLTVLKARWDRDQNQRELEAEMGTRLASRRQSINGIEFQAGLLEAKTGRRWSLEETATYMEQQQKLNNDLS